MSGSDDPHDAVSRARAILAGGCDSPVRSGWSVDGEMFVQSSARGAYAFDASGRRYVNYVMAYGPLLFGHTHAALTTGLDAIARGGFVGGIPIRKRCGLANGFVRICRRWSACASLRPERRQ